MPAPSWDDLDEFLDPDDFGVPAVITLQGGGTIALTVIFDQQAREGEVQDAFTFDTTAPRVTCREDLVRDVARGDSIALTFPAGVSTFDVVAAPQAEGTGLAVILLAVP